jgi:GNAT superfamily N-acetyltransferase
MSDIHIRRMESADRLEVAELICVSTNYWYQMRGKPAIFPGGPAATEVFFDVYEALDPGCGIVAQSTRSGRLAGSCFVHPRPTHVSLGIMNAHPNYFGQGVARVLLSHAIELADREGKPLRLVSSALNLDSFSLYTRAGMVPRTAFQDMFLDVPEGGLDHRVDGAEHVREGRPEDADAMSDLEMELLGIRRPQDFRYFLANRDRFWHVSVYEDPAGRIDGFMASCAHHGCNMIGPGTMRTAAQAASLLLAELNRHAGRRPVFLVPVECSELVRLAYAWGAKNCELHFSQVCGPWQPPKGIFMPTFLPETA